MAFRGGRGGSRGGGIKGATWEHDATLKLDFTPNDDYPRHPNLKRPSPLTPQERTQVKYYRTLRDKIHRGPLYTHSSKRDTETPAKTFGEKQFNEQYGRQTKADFDPFLGVETYSMKYQRKKRAIPLVSGMNFTKEFYPKELWSVLDGEEEAKVAKDNAALAAMGDEDPSERTKALLAKIERATGVEGAEGEEDEGEEEIEEEQDNDYEDDEEDMGGDYDAEQYFENGEDDDDDGGDGGGGDDY
ncbi:fc50114f-10fc-4e61-b86e-b22085413be9 [Sclerotinia trifoliorum]|uniref:DNA-directed RNA polymerase III subunit n=1 Tax=Sclerotinia trifoliorum TaxID=28548 RepID=A0A8H2ZVG5_9HELO|nr:fc50114f-10fc-4e61-b86e-b22085413be9 [Sclerotinia trifoliorum]